MLLPIGGGLACEEISYDGGAKKWLARSGHYLDNPPPGALAAVAVRQICTGLAGIEIATGPILGMVVLGRPTARMLPQDGSMVEIKRMVLVPGLPHGTASAVLRASAIVARAHGARIMISYHDRTRHTGCIYRKAGFRKDGKTVVREGQKGWSTRVGSAVSGAMGHGDTPKQRWRLDL